MTYLCWPDGKTEAHFSSSFLNPSFGARLCKSISKNAQGNIGKIEMPLQYDGDPIQDLERLDATMNDPLAHALESGTGRFECGSQVSVTLFHAITVQQKHPGTHQQS